MIKNTNTLRDSGKINACSTANPAPVRPVLH